MVKTVVITAKEDIPDTELGKDVTITVGANSYSGKITYIITHEVAPTPTKVTLEADNLKVVPP